MINGDDECTWVPDTQCWGWHGSKLDPEVATTAGAPQILCLSDGIFSPLVHNGRFHEFLKNFGLATVTVNSIAEAVWVAENGEIDRWCPPTVHTVVLCLGAFDIKMRSSEQVRDGILQVAEAISRSAESRLAENDSANPLQMVIYGVPPTDPSFSAEGVAGKAAEASRMLLGEGFGKHPYLRSLRMLNMLWVDDGLRSLLNVQEELFNGVVTLNSRGTGVLVQKLVDDCLPRWPGGNLSSAIYEGTKQLGLRADQSLFPFIPTAATKHPVVRGKSSVPPTAVPSKSWATIAATQRSQNPTSKADAVKSFPRLRGMRTVIKTAPV
eukprot:TRINITY_DN3931_c1_g1_i1.p1 TRINITY_DN3931_c1_g1~~TRINITY_DN3931_c1_g1_i1.p1  ORF type:complete len:324 (+),score=60.56 TRINITY_DN3931_c1_g1_i1:721-1692(+)